MKDNNRNDRRQFLKLGMTSLAYLPLASLAYRTVHAADLPLVDESSPTAVQLGYVHDAASTDTAKFPKRAGEAGSKQFCHNCSLYQGQGKEGAAPCAIFPGKAVEAGGWCNAWVAKPQ